MLVSRPVVVNNVIRIKDSDGQYGPLYVLFVLRTVMVNKVFDMSYMYQGQSWSIRYFICPTCIMDSHGQ
jgi:hypothetical protein